MTENNFSTYDIARASGNKINANTITRILNGDIQETRLSTLDAISVAFKVPLEDVVRAARGIVRSGDERYAIYAERFDADDLSTSEWEILEHYFRSQVDRFRKEKEAFGEFLMKDVDKAEIEKHNKVVARIEPPRKIKNELTRDEIQDIIAVGTATEKVKPQKRKAG